MKFKNGSFKLIGITQGNNIVESAHWLKHQTLKFVTVESQTIPPFFKIHARFLIGGFI